jgi:hypothetical protein
MMDYRGRHVFDVLWCMAHHGEFAAKPAPHLYLRKGTCKRDGHRMPDPHAHIFERLDLPGVTVKETRAPAKAVRRIADDQCGFFLDVSVGGRDALRRLRRSADTLCQHYGEPEWKGHRRWTGEAYQRFVAADVAYVEVLW